MEHALSALREGFVFYYVREIFVDNYARKIEKVLSIERLCTAEKERDPESCVR